MKKIVIVNASPRAKGNDKVIADKLIAEMKDAEVEVYNVQSQKSNFCLACNACKKNDTPACIQKDDIAALISKVDACDGIVLLTPIYFGQMSAQAKVFIDRMYCFFNPTKPGASIATKRGKKGVVLGCCGAGPTDVYGAYLQGVANSLGVIGVDENKALCFGGINAPGSIAEKEDAMAQVAEIAAWLAE